MIRVLLADDHAIILDGLAAILAQEGFEVVGLARSGRSLVDLFLSLVPDVALVGLRLPDLNGLQCIGVIRKRLPEARIVVLNSFDDPEDIDACLQAGAKGYFTKDVTRTELVKELKRINALSKGPARFVRGRKPSDLTAREREILHLLANGDANKLIAAKIAVTEGTVKLHVYNLYQKLGVNSRTEAMRVALERGLISLTTR